MEHSNKNEINKNQDGLPEVAQDKRKNPRVFIFLGILIIGAVAVRYCTPSHQQKANNVEESYSVQGGNAASASSTTPVVAAAPTGLTDEQKKALLAKKQELEQRISAPMMMVNSGGQKAEASGSSAAVTDDPNTKFMAQVSARSPDTVNATRMGDLSYIIAEGGLIHAVLETGINSDLPGYLRAIVSTPMYSEDGSRELIPVGSRLIGQYKSGMAQGQSRVFVVWTRLITPDGMTLQLGSPGVDNLGMAGFAADEVNRHFWQSFGTAVLLSMIGAGVDNIGVSSGDNYNAAQAYRVGVAESLSQTANQSLKQTGIISPTLVVNQGKPIIVFVAHDLNFADVMKQSAQNRLNVF